MFLERGEVWTQKNQSMWNEQNQPLGQLCEHGDELMKRSQNQGQPTHSAPWTGILASGIQDGKFLFLMVFLFCSSSSKQKKKL